MNTPRDPIRVFCVDDHPLVREGISALLESVGDIELVGEASNGRQALELFRRLQPDVTLMDLRMPDLGGIDAITAIRQEFGTARIVVLTTYPGDMLAQRALRAGAQGYLLKSEASADLIEMIRAVHAGMRRIDGEVARQLARHTAAEALSARELGVLELAARGNSNKLIARELDISEATVKTHMQHILEKLQADDRTHAVSVARRRGIIGF